MNRKRAWFTAVILSLAALVCFLGFRAQNGEQVARSASPVTGLPPDATNVSYQLTGGFGPLEAYEFDTSEAAFVNWTTKNGTPAQEIDSKGSDVVRLSAYNGKGTVEKRHIDRGLEYRWSQGDQSLTIAFDRDAGRAFYFRMKR